MKKKLLAGTLAFLMVGSLGEVLPLNSVNAAEEKTIVDIDYNYQVTGNVKTVKDSNNNVLYDYDLTKYGEKVLTRWYRNIETVDVTDVDYIDRNAFYGLSKVKTINLHNVKYVNSYAFIQVPELTTVNLDKCYALGNNAFSSCPNLLTLNLGDSIQHLGASVTDWCGNLRSITLNNPIEELNSDAFTNTSVKNLYLNFDPSDVKLNYTGNVIYSGCVYSYNWFNGQLKLAGFQFNADSARINSKIFGSPVVIDSMLPDTSTLKDLDLSELSNNNLLSPDLFNKLSSLDSVRVNSSLKLNLIGSSSLKNSPKLYVDGLTYQTNSYNKSLDQLYVDNAQSYKDLVIPSELFGLKVETVQDLSGLIADSLVISDSVIKLSPALFSYSNIGKVVLPRDLKTLPVSCFSNCNVKEVVLPEGLDKIEDHCFYNCKNLKIITLPDSLTTIGDSAFEGSGLSSISLPSNTINIGKNAFSVYSKILDNFKAPNSIGVNATVFGDVYTINNLETDTRFLGLYIPGFTIQSVTTPREKLHLYNDVYVFDKYQGSDESYEIPNSVLGKSVISVSDSAFLDNKTLKVLKVSEGIKSIGNCSFLRCSELEQLVLPSTITSLGTDFFGGAKTEVFTDSTYRYRLDGKYLELMGSPYTLNGDVSLPSSYGGRTITTIGKEAFKDSNFITSIKVPDTITNIKVNAFSDCDNLHSVEIGSAIRTVSDYSFNSPNLTNAKINSSAADVYVSPNSFSKGVKVEYSDKTVVVGSETPQPSLPSSPTGEVNKFYSLLLLLFGSSLLYIIKKIRRTN